MPLHHAARRWRVPHGANQTLHRDVQERSLSAGGQGEEEPVRGSTQVLPSGDEIDDALWEGFGRRQAIVPTRSRLIAASTVLPFSDPTRMRSSSPLSQTLAFSRFSAPAGRRPYAADTITIVASRTSAVEAPSRNPQTKMEYSTPAGTATHTGRPLGPYNLA